MRWEEVKGALSPDTADVEDFSYERVSRLLRFLRGESTGGVAGREGVGEEFSHRGQPPSPRLAAPMWYGGGRPRSGQLGGERGMNFLWNEGLRAAQVAGFP